MEVFRRMLKATTHRAMVTDANLKYEGGMTIAPDILKITDIREYEEISVRNVSRGTRFQTYVVAGALKSRDFCVDGVAAHLAKNGDIVIITAFADDLNLLLIRSNPLSCLWTAITDP